MIYTITDLLQRKSYVLVIIRRVIRPSCLAKKIVSEGKLGKEPLNYGNDNCHWAICPQKYNNQSKWKEPWVYT